MCANMIYMTNWYSNSDAYTAIPVDGREVRISKSINSHDALVASESALMNAMITAQRMPFAFTANTGVVIADRIPA